MRELGAVNEIVNSVVVKCVKTLGHPNPGYHHLRNALSQLLRGKQAFFSLNDTKRRWKYTQGRCRETINILVLNLFLVAV